MNRTSQKVSKLRQRYRNRATILLIPSSTSDVNKYIYVKSNNIEKKKEFRF